MASEKFDSIFDMYENLDAMDLSDDDEYVMDSALATPESEDMCDCGGKLYLSNDKLINICDNCGKSVQYEPTFDKPLSAITLRVNGPNCGKYSKELFKSAKINTEEIQKEKIYDEFIGYYERYCELVGNKNFPRELLPRAVNLYNQVQKYYVKRSESKKQTMAACLELACLEVNFAPSEKMLIKFMDLKKNFKPGKNIVNTLIDRDLLDIGLIDVIKAQVYTLFKDLEIDGQQEEVIDLIKSANKKYVGLKSKTESKVAGASWIILRPKISLDDICALKNIQRSTAILYINALK